MTVTYRDFIHPEDDRARRELEAVPGFDKVTKCFMKFGVEKFLHGSLMANCIRLSPTQLPEIYGLLPPVARKFGIAEPEFYLQMDPSPNACTMAHLLMSVGSSIFQRFVSERSRHGAGTRPSAACVRHGRTGWRASFAGLAASRSQGGDRFCCHCGRPAGA